MRRLWFYGWIHFSWVLRLNPFCLGPISNILVCYSFNLKYLNKKYFFILHWKNIIVFLWIYSMYIKKLQIPHWIFYIYIINQSIIKGKKNHIRLKYWHRDYHVERQTHKKRESKISNYKTISNPSNADQI